MEWWKRLRQRPPDDLLLNLFDLVFWAIVVGVVLGLLALFG